MRKNVVIYRGKPKLVPRAPTELESALSIGVFFSAGIPIYLAFFGPRAVSGYMLSLGLALLFLGWGYIAIFNKRFQRH